jgi:hypothetical protein
VVRGLDCSCAWREDDHDPSGRSCLRPRPVRTVTLEAVTGSRRIEIHGVPDEASLLGEQPPLQLALPSVGVGPWLFVHVHHEGNACGAHGWAWTDHAVVDLRTARLVPTDTISLTSADSAAAMDTLQATEWEGSEGVVGFTFGNQEAVWTEADTLAMLDRVFTGSTFAASDEGSYSRSERLPRLVPRPWIAPWTHAPLAVRRFWTREPRDFRAGWSLLTPADTSAVGQAFKHRVGSLDRPQKPERSDRTIPIP